MSQVFVMNLKTEFLSLGITQEKIELYLITVGGKAPFPNHQVPL